MEVFYIENIREYLQLTDRYMKIISLLSKSKPKPMGLDKVIILQDKILCLSCGAILDFDIHSAYGTIYCSFCNNKISIFKETFKAGVSLIGDHESISERIQVSATNPILLYSQNVHIWAGRNVTIPKVIRAYREARTEKLLQEQRQKEFQRVQSRLQELEEKVPDLTRDYHFWLARRVGDEPRDIEKVEAIADNYVLYIIGSNEFFKRALKQVKEFFERQGYSLSFSS